MAAFYQNLILAISISRFKMDCAKPLQWRWHLDLALKRWDISLRATHERPGRWYFRDGFQHNNVFPFVFRAALVAAAKGTKLHEKDVLPKELAAICSRIRKNLTRHGVSR